MAITTTSLSTVLIESTWMRRVSSERKFSHQALQNCMASRNSYQCLYSKQHSRHRLLPLQSRTKIMRIFWKITFSHLSKQQSPIPPNQCCGSRPSIRETNFTTLIWGKGEFFFLIIFFLKSFCPGSYLASPERD